MLAVITGGSRGIGRALVDRFAEAGFEVATCARNATDLGNLKAETEREYITTIHTFQADLSQKSEVKAFADFVIQLKKPVAVLINNTGFFLPGAVTTEAEGNLEMMIQTNLYSAYYLTRTLVPTMIAQQAGHIFNICSIASLIAYPNGGSYSISKFALYGMSKVLREELKPHHIRVTAILPGATLTDSWAGVDLPAERFMKSEDIAEIVYATYQLSKNTVVEDIILRPQLGDI
jgi:short-subunit dehydrogenase